MQSFQIFTTATSAVPRVAPSHFRTTSSGEGFSLGLESRAHGIIRLCLRRVGQRPQGLEDEQDDITSVPSELCNHSSRLGFSGPVCAFLDARAACRCWFSSSANFRDTPASWLAPMPPLQARDHAGCPLPLTRLCVLPMQDTGSNGCFSLAGYTGE
ncbi:hypothetical protein VTI74DRAFT_1504 [Chaetomium olivicolor]